MIPLTNEEALKMHQTAHPPKIIDLPVEIMMGDLELDPVDWVIDNIIPEGVCVIGGSPSVGKTTGTLPLAMCAAGFISHLDSTIKVSTPRHVCVFSEDPSQIKRILHGVLKHLKRADGLPVTSQSINEKVHIYTSKRVDSLEMGQRLRDVIEKYTIQDPVLGSVAPLIILDTSSANLELRDENSNSEISAQMAEIKTINTDTGAPVWVISHLAKTAKGAKIDELTNFSARGGGAWEGDANWTAIIARDGEKTVFKISKERCGGDLAGTEVHFSVNFLDEFIKNRRGDLVRQAYPVVSIVKSNASARKYNEFLGKVEQGREEISAAIEAGGTDDGHFVLTEIKNALSGDNNLKKKIIEKLLEEEVLEKYEIPQKEAKNAKRKTGYKFRRMQTDVEFWKKSYAKTA